MPAYASIEDLRSRMNRPLTADEVNTCPVLLSDAGVLIDAYRKDADPEKKKIVSCRMVIRTLGSGALDIPIGASQGSQSGLGYSQSWTLAGGGAGELYLSKTERQMLGGGNAIGARSPLEDLVCEE